MSGQIALPEYFPLKVGDLQHMNKALHELDRTDRTLETLQRELYDTIATYIENSLMIAADGGSSSFEEAKSALEDSEDVKKAAALLGEVSSLSSQAASYTQATAQFKTTMTDRVKVEEQIHMFNIENFTNMGDRMPEEPVQVFEKGLEQASSKRSNIRHSAENYLKVLVNPQVALPTDDDDDIAVEGGQVSLHCPISKEIMKTPVTSRCGHTFDKANIMSLMGNGRRRIQCPECPVDIGAGDLKPDKMMELRLKCYKRDQQIRDKFKSTTDDIVRL